MQSRRKQDCRFVIGFTCTTPLTRWRPGDLAQSLSMPRFPPSRQVGKFSLVWALTAVLMPRFCAMHRPRPYD